MLPKNHKLAVSPHNQFICRIGGRIYTAHAAPHTRAAQYDTTTDAGLGVKQRSREDEVEECGCGLKGFVGEDGSHYDPPIRFVTASPRGP